MKKSKLKFYAKILDNLKIEINKRNDIYKLGVDLINYENGYTKAVIDIIIFELPFLTKDDIDWYLYETVDKVYYFNDKPDLDVSESLNFLTYHMNCK